MFGPHQTFAFRQHAASLDLGEVINQWRALFPCQICSFQYFVSIFEHLPCLIRGCGTDPELLQMRDFVSLRKLGLVRFFKGRAVADRLLKLNHFFTQVPFENAHDVLV